MGGLSKREGRLGEEEKNHKKSSSPLGGGGSARGRRRARKQAAAGGGSTRAHVLLTARHHVLAPLLGRLPGGTQVPAVSFTQVLFLSLSNRIIMG